MNADLLALRLYGTTAREAQRGPECIRCGEPVILEDLEPVDLAEYRITAICPKCWDRLFPEDAP